MISLWRSLGAIEELLQILLWWQQVLGAKTKLCSSRHWKLLWFKEADTAADWLLGGGGDLDFLSGRKMIPISLSGGEMSFAGPHLSCPKCDIFWTIFADLQQKENI